LRKYIYKILVKTESTDFFSVDGSTQQNSGLPAPIGNNLETKFITKKFGKSFSQNFFKKSLSKKVFPNSFSKKILPKVF